MIFLLDVWIRKFTAFLSVCSMFFWCFVFFSINPAEFSPTVISVSLPYAVPSNSCKNWSNSLLSSSVLNIPQLSIAKGPAIHIKSCHINGFLSIPLLEVFWPNLSIYCQCCGYFWCSVGIVQSNLSECVLSSRRFMKWNATIIVTLFFNPHELTKIVLKSSRKFYGPKLNHLA